MRYFLITLFIGIFYHSTSGQSLEIMVGNERIFADVQWLKFIDQSRKWSVFSRTRATVDYENQSNLFSGAYLNATTKSGIGLSIIGKIGNQGGGGDAGIHIFKAKSNWMLFGLASVGFKNKLEYSWFSIFRFTPKINSKLKLYFSVELFNLFERDFHLISVQRIRLGIDFKSFQFGAAANFSEIGKNWSSQSNLGGFIRKSF